VLGRSTRVGDTVAKCPACGSHVLFFSVNRELNEPSSVRARCEACGSVYRVHLTDDGSIRLQET
jgi:uncharacterized protein (DUF983 family)